MSYAENFDVDEGDFGLVGDIAWTGSFGNPGLGCIFSNHSPFPLAGGGIMSRGGLPDPVATGDVIRFYYRAITIALGLGSDMVHVVGSFLEGGSFSEIIDQPASPGDTGWLLYTYTILSGDNGKHVNSLQIGTMNTWQGEGTIYFDTVFVGSAPPPPVTVAKFYQGSEGSDLTDQFDLPFDVVDAGSLALRRDGKVAIANRGTGTPIVIVAGPNSYGSYDDKSLDHPAEPIKRVRWVG